MFKTSLAISPTPSAFAPLLFAGEWKLGVKTALELGFDAVELSLRDPCDKVIPEIVSELHRSDLALSAVATGQSYYQDGLSLTNPILENRAKLLNRIKRFIELVAPWAGMVILGGVRGVLKGDQTSHNEQRLMAIDMIKACSDIASQNGVRLLLEPINRYETNFLNTVQECLDLIVEANLQNVYILADTFHMNIEEKSIGEAMLGAGTKLGYLHFSDSNRKAPGQGHINFLELTHTIKKMGYEGYISAEILPLPDNRTAATMAIEYYRSLDSPQPKSLILN
jgi:sugar phosphate isomerase/epimerase